MSEQCSRGLWVPGISKSAERRQPVGKYKSGSLRCTVDGDRWQMGANERNRCVQTRVQRLPLWAITEGLPGQPGLVFGLGAESASAALCSKNPGWLTAHWLPRVVWHEKCRLGHLYCCLKETTASSWSVNNHCCCLDVAVMLTCTLGSCPGAGHWAVLRGHVGWASKSILV